LLGQHGDQDVGADVAALDLLVHAHGVAADHALALEPLDPALHGGARQAQPARDLGGGGAGVLAQGGQQLGVGGRDLHHLRNRFVDSPKSYGNLRRFTLSSDERIRIMGPRRPRGPSPDRARLLPAPRPRPGERLCPSPLPSPHCAPTAATAAPTAWTTPPSNAWPRPTPNCAKPSTPPLPNMRASGATSRTSSNSTKPRRSTRSSPATSTSTPATRSTPTW